MKNFFQTLLVAIMASVGVHGWAADDVRRLPLVFKVPDRSLAPAQPASCQYEIRNVGDGRRNKDTVGASSMPRDGLGDPPFWIASFHGADGVTWITGAAQALPQFGIAIAAGGRPIDVNLRLAEAWSDRTTYVTHVMFEATVPAGEQTTAKRYHGIGTDGVGSTAALPATFNEAMADALQAYASDLRAACIASRPPA